MNLRTHGTREYCRARFVVPITVSFTGNAAPSGVVMPCSTIWGDFVDGTSTL